MASVLKWAGIEPGEELPAYGWPGGYPIVYMLADSGLLCPDCANRKNGSIAFYSDTKDCPDDEQWRIIGGFVHYEGAPEYCDHCNAEIPSAYGDPEDSEDSDG